MVFSCYYVLKENDLRGVTANRALSGFDNIESLIVAHVSIRAVDVVLSVLKKLKV